MMKRSDHYKTKLIFFCLLCLSLCASAQKLRIACVGNSITFGSGVVNREKNSYPAQLQHMLGEDYEVINFGVSGTTLLKNGNKPYWKTKAYEDVLGSNPDIVFIKLGTNDSKGENRPFYDEFKKNYIELIESFQRLPTKPRIVLLLPLPSFLNDSTSIYDPVIVKDIIPRIKEVAYRTNSEIIDLHSLFIDEAGLLPDLVHPSSLGASVIAKRLYEVVLLKGKRGFDVFSKIREEKELSSFHGFECADFVFNSRKCKIVKPKKVAEGAPWIWRARFWGHEPQADLALLERGFHLMYCDVSELYGNKESIDLWNGFYSYMRKLGFAEKVTLEAMSRGGIYAYNWALDNPDKVASVYADAPVLDLKSWPGGKGKSKGSEYDWDLFKKNYNLTENQANQFSGSPLDKAITIAKLGFPILHVVGDADNVVPIDENTLPFEKYVRENGGNITVIHKPKVNHHPHSLANPTPIVDFILRATGYKTNFAALPIPGSEYRSGAGWTGGTDWWQQQSDIDSLLTVRKKLDILFVGNSITQGIAGHRPNVTHRPGKAAFEKAFSDYRWECAGISGDRTQNVLWRLKNGHYTVADPLVIVVTIGVNNFNGDTPEEIATGIGRIAQWIRDSMPHTKLVLLGPLPAGMTENSPYRLKYKQVQVLIQKHMSDESRIICENLKERFIMNDENGKLNQQYYSRDGIHLISSGYEVFAEEIATTIKKLVRR